MIDSVTARRGFLDALAVGESAGRYDILCGGGRFEGYAQFPQWAGVDLGGGISHAAGRYQFEPATWREQAAKLGLKDFSPASQDLAAWDLAATVYHARIRRNLESDLIVGRLAMVAPALHSTWTSLSSATFAPRFRTAVATLARAKPAVDSKINAAAAAKHAAG